MLPTFFSTPEDFRKWLQKHSKKEKELLVGFYKIGSGKPSLTWSQSVDEALCFGWIDGVRRSIDAESYTIRFTPRKPGSIWSAVNIAKMETLIANGLMQPAGLAAFEKRQAAKSGIYSYEQAEINLAGEYENLFKEDKAAWTFFEKQPPGYRKQMTGRIMAAKRKETQLSRLQTLIKASGESRRIQ